MTKIRTNTTKNTTNFKNNKQTIKPNTILNLRNKQRKYLHKKPRKSKDYKSKKKKITPHRQKIRIDPTAPLFIKKKNYPSTYGNRLYSGTPYETRTIIFDTHIKNIIEKSASKPTAECNTTKISRNAANNNKMARKRQLKRGKSTKKKTNKPKGQQNKDLTINNELRYPQRTQETS